MDAEEITKLVDGVYKNILEKFNPGARQLITAGKAYLKALHGAASASRMFNEASAKIAMNSQQSGTGDIGSALMNIVNVYKEIQDQQMNIMKAFYVDLLVPLETNLEKDTKVVQHEQKKFLQQHKIRMESYHKAVNTIKKQRKKKNSPENTEKEIKSLQILDDQKKKLDNFCEQSYKNAMTQERRRYGFVLERQCSIAKHWMAYYTHGKTSIEHNLDNWQEVAASREVIPTVYETNFLKRLEKLKEDESHSGSSMLKKARSVDAPYGDMRTLNENNYSQNSLPRAKSDFNLTTAASSNENWDQRPFVKALYAYMPSGENQLPFAEGDRIALVGNKAKGWQFGENLRTQMFGWFPIAYTNAENSDNKVDRDRDSNYENVQFERNGMRSYQEYLSNNADGVVERDSTLSRKNNRTEESSPTRRFGDTIMLKNQKKYRGISGTNPKPGPPPTLPAPVPSASNSSRMLNVSQSFCLPNGPPIIERRKHKNQNGLPPKQSMMYNNQKHLHEGTAKTSLHSSNDSGFANEPPPQPEVDYSDEEHSNRVPIRRRADDSYQLPREVNSWTLSRNFKSSPSSSQNMSTILRKPMKPSASFENVIASDDEILHGGAIKRTKSFWRFGKSDDILAGMSLWRHRDLVQLPVPQVDENSIERPTSNTNTSKSSAKLEKNSSRHSTSSYEAKPRKESSSTMENYEDENIYGIAVLDEDVIRRQYHNQQQKQQSYPETHVPKSRTKIMKINEIGIEHLSDPERINTFKHMQHKEYKGNTQHDLSRSNKKKHKLQTDPSNKKAIIKVNNNTSNSKKVITQQHIKKPQNIVSRHEKSSSESDGDQDDEDDDDTLKMSDVNNFFDDISAQECGEVMKTVKRQDILKQYYTSDGEESDIEIKSASSDPYDCIVINDHLVRRDEKNRRQFNSYHEQMEFQTFRSVPKKPICNSNDNGSTLNNSKSGNSNDEQKRTEESYIVDSNTIGQTATILPRTKLMKPSNFTLEKNLKKNEDNNANINAEKAKSFAKTYGPWYDFWDQQSEEHSSQNSKILK